MAGTQPTGSSFVVLLQWALEWWLDGRDPGLAIWRRNVDLLAPVSRWGAGAALAVAITVAAALLTLRRNGADLADVVIGVGRFLLVLSAGWLLLTALWALADGVAGWIIGPRDGAAEYVAGVEQALTQADPTLAGTLSLTGTGAVLAFVAAVVGRTVLAVILAAALPVLAAISLRRTPAVLRTAAAWVIAILAFEPLMAVVYRVSHDLVLRGREPVVVLVVASLTFLLGAALLPGVARLVSGVRP